jgi:membrane protein implicated in regulation of membrane protease activity
MARTLLAFVSVPFVAPLVFCLIVVMLFWAEGPFAWSIFAGVGLLGSPVALILEVCAGVPLYVVWRRTIRRRIAKSKDTHNQDARS